MLTSRPNSTGPGGAEEEVLRLSPYSSPTDLPSAVASVVRLFDGKRTLAQVSDEARVSRTGALVLAEQLRRQGLLETSGTLRRARRTAAAEGVEVREDKPDASIFTDLEESFFASEVDPAAEEEDRYQAPFLSRLASRLADQLYGDRPTA
jgi:hypothetical protein